MPSGIGRGRRLSNAERAEIRARIHAGEQYRAVAAVMGCDPLTVQQVVARYGGVASRMRPRPAIRLAAAEREELSRGLLARRSLRQIAAQLGRAPSTIAREVRANGGRCHYRAWQAERRAERRLQRPKVAKLVRRPALRAVVEQGLAQYWSPHDRPRPRLAELGAEAIDVVVVAADPDEPACRRSRWRGASAPRGRPGRRRTSRRPAGRGVGGDGVGEVAGRGAGDRVEPELARLGDRDRRRRGP